MPTVHKDFGFLFKPKIIFVAKICISVIILSFLIRSIQASTLFAAFHSAKWHFLGIAAFFVAPNLLIQTLKWFYILRLANPSVSLSTAFRSLLIGYPLGFVTPGRLGEIGRAFFVPEIEKQNVLRLFALDKAANLIVIICAGVWSLLFLQRLPYPVSGVWAGVILILSLAAMIGVFFLSVKPIKAIGRFIKIPDFNKRNLALILGFSISFYVIYLAQFLVLLFAFETNDLSAAAHAAGATFFVKTILPISLGDIGVREGASVYYFGKIGFQAASAFHAALLLFVLNIGVPTLFGLPILHRASKQSM